MKRKDWEELKKDPYDYGLIVTLFAVKHPYDSGVKLFAKPKHKHRCVTVDFDGDMMVTKIEYSSEKLEDLRIVSIYRYGN